MLAHPKAPDNQPQASCRDLDPSTADGGHFLPTRASGDRFVGLSGGYQGWNLGCPSTYLGLVSHPN